MNVLYIAQVLPIFLQLYFYYVINVFLLGISYFHVRWT